MGYAKNIVAQSNPLATLAACRISFQFEKVVENYITLCSFEKAQVVWSDNAIPVT
jgi:hypothetical protein